MYSKYYQDNGKIMMTYDNSVARMTRSTFNPATQKFSSSTGFKDQKGAPKIQTQYQIMSNYQS